MQRLQGQRQQFPTGNMEYVSDTRNRTNNKKIMKKTTEDRINTIINNLANLTFFKAKSFHGDKGYSIITVDNQDYFGVKTGQNIMAYYELNGSRIGSYKQVFNIKN